MVRSVSVRDLFRIRLGSVLDSFAARSPSVRDPKIFRRTPAAGHKITQPRGALSPTLPTADTGFYIIYLLHNLMGDAVKPLWDVHDGEQFTTYPIFGGKPNEDMLFV